MIRRVLKPLLMALVPLAVLVALIEAAFWAFGVGGGDETLHLSRGFDRDAAYLVPHEGVVGAWRTQMFEEPELEVQIPPRSPRRRLILFGGSNTQGFPHADLQQRLNAADPDPGWEVVNLGRAGYGSERVSILFGQALERLRPDVVLIYSGHNEFMENSFLEELQGGSLAGWSGPVADTLMQLRSARWLAEQLRPERIERGGDRRPEPKQIGRSPEFRDFDYSETLRFHDAYRANLQRMLDAAAGADVGVVLCTVIGNDFEPPLVPSHAASLSNEDRTRYGRLEGRALAALPEAIRTQFIEIIRLRPTDWGMGGLRSEELAERRAETTNDGRAVPPLRPLLGPLAVTASTPPPHPTSAYAHWTDTELWTTATYEALERMSATFARTFTPDERAGLEQAAQLWREALEISPDSPFGRFRLGYVLYLLGDEQGAATELAAAFAYDRAPRRGNDVSNGIVRALAAERPRIVLVDAEGLFRERSPGGLISYEIMTDVCHLQPGARYVLMADFAPAVLAAQVSRQR